MADIQQFRIALRGFHRQDVRDYVERMACAHRQELAELQKKLEKSEHLLREEMSQAEAKLAAAEKEARRLQAKVDELTPLAAGYQELRDRAAGMEQEACQKANAEVSEIREEAERIRADAKKWLSRVMEEYSSLRVGLDGVLERVQALSGVSETVKELDETAQQLRDQWDLK